jgi:hypothetical protein
MRQPVDTEEQTKVPEQKTPEAPTQEQINEWKQLYKRVFRKELCGRSYYFRPLYRSDWLEILNFVRENPDARGVEFDEKVVERGILFPEMAPTEWATLEAGVIPTLSMYIRDKSGFIVEGLSDTTFISAVPIADEPPGDPPTEEEKAELKSRYSVYPLRLIHLGNKYWVIRPITRLEWRQLQAETLSESDIDLLVCQRCVVWASGGHTGKNLNWDMLPVGYATTLSAKVLELSGFNMDVKTVEEL